MVRVGEAALQRRPANPRRRRAAVQQVDWPTAERQGLPNDQIRLQEDWGERGARRLGRDRRCDRVLDRERCET